MFGRWVGLTLAAMGLTVAAPPALANCSLNKFAELPVTMEGTRPITPVKVNGADVRLLADSGAFFSHLDFAKATELKLNKEQLPPWLTISGVAGQAEAYLTTVKTFTIANTTVRNVQFLVASLGGDADTDGVLGQNVLGLGDVEYDFHNGAIRLWQPRGCGDRLLAYWDRTGGASVVRIEPRDERDPKTIGEVFVNGQKLRAMFDTGATRSVVSRAAAARAGVTLDSPGVVTVGRAGGVGGRTLADWRAPFATFKIGDEEVRNVKLDVADLQTVGIDMLVGSDFFVSHRVYVSNSQHRLYLTYEGGPVFSADAGYRRLDAATHTERDVAPPADDAAEPTTAEGYSRRGASRLARNDRSGALADLDRAVALAPEEPAWRLQRARARLAAGQRVLAMADLDKALSLKPDDPAILLARAGAMYVSGDTAAALADLQAADRAAPREWGERLALGELFLLTGRGDLALGAYDQWLATHPDHPDIGRALSARCRTRALADLAPDLAQKDCNRAIALGAGLPGPLESRGYLRLRRGELEAAAADFTAALALGPERAWALYGRGLAEARLGRRPQAEADVAAALQRERRLAALMKTYGLEDPFPLPPPRAAIPPPPPPKPAAAPQS